MKTKCAELEQKKTGAIKFKNSIIVMSIDFKPTNELKTLKLHVLRCGPNLMKKPRYPFNPIKNCCPIFILKTEFNLHLYTSYLYVCILGYVRLKSVRPRTFTPSNFILEAIIKSKTEKTKYLTVCPS